MRHVALGAADRIVLLQEAYPALQFVRPPHHGRRFERRDVAADQIEQVVNVADFDRELAVHVSFAQGKPRPQRQPDPGPPGVNANGHVWAGPPSFKSMLPAGCIDDGELAFVHYAGKYPS